jgi:hypothetical protein
MVMLIGSHQYVLNLFLNINLIDLVSIIPNPTNRITFFFYNKYETSKSYKYRDLFIDKRKKNINDDWLMIKSNLWSQTVTRLMIKEKEFLVQLSTFNKKKRLIKFYWVWPIMIIYQRMTLVIKWLKSQEQFTKDLVDIHIKGI